MDKEQYIEQEVKLRVLKEMTEERFSETGKRFINIDERFDRLENKIDSNFHIILVIFIASVLLPVVLSAMKFI